MSDAIEELRACALACPVTLEGRKTSIRVMAGDVRAALDEVDRLRARVGDLEAEDRRWRERWAKAVAGPVGYFAGAEAMRERAAAVAEDEEIECERLRQLEAAACARVVARGIRALPLDDGAREDAPGGSDA